MNERWDRTRLDHRSRQAASIAASAMALLTERGGPALTMAAIADQADVSRQTLYRYYKDVDAVLVGIAELVTSHDVDFARLVNEQPDPGSKLELIARTATGGDHGEQTAASLLAVLPPAGREIVVGHQERARDLLAEVLQRGVDQGSFRDDLVPRTDAQLILGILGAAGPNSSERAIFLVRRLVEPNHPARQPVSSTSEREARND